MNFYRPKFFQLCELVHPDIEKQLGNRAWGLLDARMLWTIDQLRNRFGVCIINGVYRGHRYTESGLRKFDSNVGVSFSLHKYGCAFDLKFISHTADAIRSDMMTNSHLPCYQYITRCERNVSWLHIDNYNVFSQGITFFNP